MAEKVITYDDVFPPGGIRPRGLFHVFGAPGVGKSTFCITVGVTPDRIAVFDFESSLLDAHEQLHFGVYHNMVAEWTNNLGITAPPRELYGYMLQLIQQLPESIDVIVVDNIDPLESALEDAVEANPDAYGLTRAQLERGRGLKWGAIKRLYAVLIQFMLGKAQLVGFTSHLRPVWAGGQPVPGLYQPRGKQDVLDAQTFLRLWLMPRPNGPEPSALVLKSRLSIFEPSPNGLRPRPVLPRKLPVATWEKIREYFSNPANLDSPPPEERLTEADWHRLRGTLSKEQLDLIKLIISAEQQQAAAVQPEEQKKSSKLPSNPAEFVIRVQKDFGLTLDEALSRLEKQITELDPQADYLKLQSLL